MVAWLLENPEACLAARRPCQAASIAPMAHRGQSATLGAAAPASAFSKSRSGAREDSGAGDLARKESPARRSAVPPSSSAGRRPTSERGARARPRSPRPPGSPRSTNRIPPPSRIRARPAAAGRGRPRRPWPPPATVAASDAHDSDVVGGQPGPYLGPSVRIPFFPGPEGRSRDDDPREIVANDALDQPGEVRVRAELSQQGRRIAACSRRPGRQGRSRHRFAHALPGGNRRATRAPVPGHWNCCRRARAARECR